MSRLLLEYRERVRPLLQKNLGYRNIMKVPRIEKIVVNVALGEAVQDPKLLEVVAEDLSRVTGQRPHIIRAKKSVAAYHLRKGMPIGLRVTLRKFKAYDFLDRLINFALPRVRDFRGLSRNSFDGHGNYNFGLDEQTVFPEIEVDKVKKVFGMDISIVTTAENDEEAMRLLEAFGFPFERG
ncbi:MAG TPA: 50S ribosomal protein L5 [Candidatus Hydrothermia bacterium]|nr:50S ribosomal protein L5 [Candidatus Hydrothermae bacterium]MDD3648936.1 50S ribosomal protein L5 [Candidatus Hydrothermia bacterium]MDD5573402.1 50S ribosomal protein L5 [Candidatus Hydrothermia bacterium]HOK23177.1 50S ribosomal protein L5 [Candidatus Hydrothermia bacterium]HOL23881.1 50S ribosomal protein L5 [Candidatus Hydrothermia bacterium]